MRPPAALNSTLSGLNNRMIVADYTTTGGSFSVSKPCVWSTSDPAKTRSHGVTRKGYDFCFYSVFRLRFGPETRTLLGRWSFSGRLMFCSNKNPRLF
jgi:hypothetical protein